MAKKNRREKELARLRREVEVLRAQLTTQRPSSSTTQKVEDKQIIANGAKEEKLKRSEKATITQRVDPKFLKADLAKSAVLTFAALAALVALTLLL